MNCKTEKDVKTLGTIKGANGEQATLLVCDRI